MSSSSSSSTGNLSESSHADAENFECNICFDVAKEPVVTSCGHLFCWPCLYDWLHIHSDEHMECPVCRGELTTESNITPIYGRGQSSNESTETNRLTIPPRPRAHRLERVESSQDIPLPILTRCREGIASLWRRWVSPQMRSRTNRGSVRSDMESEENIVGMRRSTVGIMSREVGRISLVADQSSASSRVIVRIIRLGDSFEDGSTELSGGAGSYIRLSRRRGRGSPDVDEEDLLHARRRRLN